MAYKLTLFPTARDDLLDSHLHRTRQSHPRNVVWLRTYSETDHQQEFPELGRGVQHGLLH